MILLIVNNFFRKCIINIKEQNSNRWGLLEKTIILKYIKLV